VWLLFFIVPLVLNCGREEKQIVAGFGSHQITLDEFRVAYLNVVKQPNVFDSRKLREAFLDEMINRRLLAQVAIEKEIDKNEKFKLNLNAFQNKCLREEHYQVVIEPQVQISETLLVKTYQFSREQRRVKHLFFNKKEQADSIYSLLQYGIDFDEIAQHIFKDTSLANSGGDLGWIYWDQMEYDLAMAIFGQPVNQISAPVASTLGYHIIKVTDWKKDPFITREELEKNRAHHFNLLKSKIGDRIANQYIDEMMKKVKIKVNPRAMKIVAEKLEAHLKEKSVPLLKQKSSPLTGAEQQQIERNLWDLRNEALFYLNNEVITIGEFVSYLPYIPTPALHRNFKTVMNFAVRDAQLTREANELHLAENSATIKTKIKLFQEYQLQLLFRKSLIDSIRVTEEEIQEKMMELSQGRDVNMSFEEYQPIIGEFLKREQRSTRVPEFIQQERAKVQIQKNVDMIHQYFDSIDKKTTGSKEDSIDPPK
jgi:parvulin-like peptidyl-prolyl isomerase